jgi:hypothetical protein
LAVAYPDNERLLSSSPCEDGLTPIKRRGDAADSMLHAIVEHTETDADYHQMKSRLELYSPTHPPMVSFFGRFLKRAHSRLLVNYYQEAHLLGARQM